MEHHLAEAEEAAAAFVAAQSEAITAWRRWAECSEAAKAACPAEVKLPFNSLCTFGELRMATEIEIYRVGAELDNIRQNRRGFPAGKAYDITANPDDIEPLLNKVRAASARVLAHLTGKDSAP